MFGERHRRSTPVPFACVVCNQGRHRGFRVTVRRIVRPGPPGDANADANWESEPVGCCRSNGPERIQETVPDGASQAPYAFWKCGWWGNPPRGFESLSLRIAFIGQGIYPFRWGSNGST